MTVQQSQRQCWVLRQSSDWLFRCRSVAGYLSVCAPAVEQTSLGPKTVRIRQYSLGLIIDVTHAVAFAFDAAPHMFRNV